MYDERPLFPEPLNAELDALLAAWRSAFGGSPANGDDVCAFPTGHSELLDDAGGRFVIDADSGNIMLADPELARTELGCVHAVRVRIRDPLRGEYESVFHLRIAESLPVAVLPDGLDPLSQFEPHAPASPDGRSSFA